MTSHRSGQPVPPVLETTDAGLRDGWESDAVVVVAVGYAVDGDVPVIDADSVAALDDLGLDPFLLLHRRGGVASAGSVTEHELLRDAGPELVALVSLGDGSSAALRRAGAAVGRLARRRGPLVTSIGACIDTVGLGAFAEGLVIGPFGYHLKTTEGAAEAPRVLLTGTGATSAAEAVDAGQVRATASWLARTYALTPSNHKSPQTLEAWAREAAEAGGLDVHVWDEARLTAQGFGGILAVGSGSQHEPRLIRLDYTPSRAARAGRRGRVPHVVLVGKGITFDSGGLSLKPRAAMETMKRDMTGGGVVIAVMAALRHLAVPVRVTGLVASAENALGASSMRPGDVVTHYGGRTSLVNNTDAEGRLVLADALAYADRELEPDTVIDIATLTGAGKMALGQTLGGLFTGDDDLAAGLLAAGGDAGEPLWRLPLSAEYAELLDNEVADVDNAAGSPGATTAALFLQGFTGGRRWAHLDIASVGDAPADTLEYTKGATGFGARLLLHHLTSG